MNTYMVTAEIDNGDSLHGEFTVANESAARKAARESFRECGRKVEVKSVELLKENQMATKQQERDALAAIKKMVDDLGPQSYLATAFDGCFEIAESNIDNDFGESMKDRCDSAMRELELTKEAIASQSRSVESLLAETESLKAALAEEKEKSLSCDDLTDVSQLLAGKVLDLGKEVSNAAERIVEEAGHPESAAFLNAVKDHRASKADLEYYTALLTRVNSVAKAGE